MTRTENGSAAEQWEDQLASKMMESNMIHSKDNDFQGSKAEITQQNSVNVFEQTCKYLRRADPVTIDLRLFICSIESINTLRQELVCEFLLSANWLEKLDVCKVDDKGNVSWESMWDPRIYFPNAVEMKSSINKRIICTDNVKGTVMIQWSYRVKGRFKCPFDITTFPFDDQVLRIHVSSYWSNRVIRFRQELSIGNNISSALANFADGGQWELQTYILSDVVEPSDGGAFSKEIKEPLFQFHVHARRKYNYYLWNIAAMVNMISFLAFTSFAIERNDTGKRLSVSLTLLLTVVAFKNFVSSILPKVSYLTLMDKYVLFNVAFIFLVSVQNAVVGKVSEPSEKEYYDEVFLFLSTCIYILFQGGFVLVSVRAVKKSRCRFRERFIGEFSIIKTLWRASEILNFPVRNTNNGLTSTDIESQIDEEVLGQSVSHSGQLPRKKFEMTADSAIRKCYSFFDALPFQNHNNNYSEPYLASPTLCLRKDFGTDSESDDSDETFQVRSVRGAFIS
ncbi:glutamate-gated chloride channel alpha-like [Clytia hemisphaerica]|uniref:Uncharacterized protein n=1 Tax=Clytia hemisphaerica TaxID=252671 RepID=A0A7M5WRN3_9CNID